MMDKIKKILKFIFNGCKCQHCRMILNDVMLTAENGHQYYIVKEDIIREVADGQ